MKLTPELPNLTLNKFISFFTLSRIQVGIIMPVFEEGLSLPHPHSQNFYKNHPKKFLRRGGVMPLMKAASTFLTG